jgi:hypothetical protein
VAFTPDEQIPPDFVASFEKAAFWGALSGLAQKAMPFLRKYGPGVGSAAARAGARGAQRFTPEFLRPTVNALKMVGGKYGPNAVGQAFAPYGKQLERGIVNASGSLFGQNAKPLTHRLIRGLPQEMVRQSAGGAIAGGLLEGGLGAAFAEDGEGLSAFAKGLGSGALSGAAFGAVSGGIGKGITNARSEATRRMALNQGVAPKNLNKVLKEQNERGFFGSIKDVYTGKGSLGRAGAGLGATGALAQFGGEWFLPSMILPGGDTEPPTPPPPQPYQAPPSLQQAQQPQPKLGAYGLRPIDFTRLPGYYTKRN